MQPYVRSLPADAQRVKGDNGLGEWYGHARFTHPSPAAPTLLKELFPFYEIKHRPTIVPSKQGETIEELHQRCAYALQTIIQAEDMVDIKEYQATGLEKPRALLICTHAASMIAMGRALTGRIPEDLAEDDFQTYTCGVSKFVRKVTCEDFTPAENTDNWVPGMGIPNVDLGGGQGVGGGWTCVQNSNCDFLTDGPERGW